MWDHRHTSALQAVVKAAAVPCCSAIGRLVSHQCALAWLNALNQVFCAHSSFKGVMLDLSGPHGN